jgi:hypothetical protein
MSFGGGGGAGGGIPDAPATGQIYGRQNNAWIPAVRKAGDTMAGPLILPAIDPVLDDEATRKLYVDVIGMALDAADAILQTQVDARVKIAGDTMTGPLTLPAVDPAASDEATRKLYVDTADAALQGQITAVAGGLVYVGAYDVAADLADFTPASGLADGPLPLPNIPGIYRGSFLICTNSGIGTGNAPAVPLERGDFLISGGPGGGPSWNVLPAGQAQITAGQVALNPIVAGWTDVQQAVEGLEAARANLSADLVPMNPAVSGWTDVQAAVEGLDAKTAGGSTTPERLTGSVSSGNVRLAHFANSAGPNKLSISVAGSRGNARQCIQFDFSTQTNLGAPAGSGAFVGSGLNGLSGIASILYLRFYRDAAGEGDLGIEIVYSSGSAVSLVMEVATKGQGVTTYPFQAFTPGTMVREANLTASGRIEWTS